MQQSDCQPGIWLDSYSSIQAIIRWQAKSWWDSAATQNEDLAAEQHIGFGNKHIINAAGENIHHNFRKQQQINSYLASFISFHIFQKLCIILPQHDTNLDYK